MIAIILIVCLIACGSCSYYSWNTLKKAKEIKINKDNKNKQLLIQKEEIQKDLVTLTNQKLKFLEEFSDKKIELAHELEVEKRSLEKKIDLQRENLSYAGEQYVAALEKHYNQIEQEYDEKIERLQVSEVEVLRDLETLKNTLSAGVQANLREQEKKEKIDFYKLPISDNDLLDIKVLLNIAPSLRKPVILNKLIWSTYFQKQTTELCNRIVGVEKVCGIYKIVNLETQQCYIGQSVDIAQRWKDHVKCGLGIDAPATNKLYNAMQKYGVWNFTFEVIEKCSRELLNEKERSWIELYQSDKFGYNSTKGNK